MKGLVVFCVVVIIAMYTLTYPSRVERENVNDLMRRQVVETVVEPGDGVDKIMNRALGAERSSYSLAVKRTVFRKLNPEITFKLSVGTPVKVPSKV